MKSASACASLIVYCCLLAAETVFFCLSLVSGFTIFLLFMCVCSLGSRRVCSPAPNEGSFQSGASCQHLQPTGPGPIPQEQTGGGPLCFVFRMFFLLLLNLFQLTSFVSIFLKLAE